MFQISIKKQKTHSKQNRAAVGRPLFLIAGYAKARLPRLKSEIRYLAFRRFLYLERPRLQVNPVSLHAYRPVGADGADVFATAAAHADIGVYRRDGQPVFIRYHLHRLGGAVLGARPAARAFRVHYAEFRGKNYAPDLQTVFLFHGYRKQCAGRAYRRAYNAVEIAKPLFERHDWHHYPGDTVLRERRFQSPCRAFGYAQVAGRAMFQQTFGAAGSGGANGGSAFRFCPREECRDGDDGGQSG